MLVDPSVVAKLNGVFRAPYARAVKIKTRVTPLKVDGRNLRTTRKEVIEKKLVQTLEKVLNLDVDFRDLTFVELEDRIVDQSRISFPPVTKFSVGGVDVAFLAVAGQSVLSTPSALKVSRAYGKFITEAVTFPAIFDQSDPQEVDFLFFLPAAGEQAETVSVLHRAVSFAAYLSCRFGLKLTQSADSYYTQYGPYLFGIKEGSVIGAPSAEVSEVGLQSILDLRRQWPSRTPRLTILAALADVLMASGDPKAVEVVDDLCLLSMLCDRVKRGEFDYKVSSVIFSDGYFDKAKSSPDSSSSVFRSDAPLNALILLRGIATDLSQGYASEPFWTALPEKLFEAGLTARAVRSIYTRKADSTSPIRPRTEKVLGRLLELIKELESL